MITRGGQLTTLSALLLVAVVILMSSTVYLAFVVYRGSTPSNTVTSQLSPLGNLQALQATQVATGSSSRSLTVSGIGQVNFVPNEALVGVSVITSNSTAQQATSSNAKTLTDVIRALNGIGISNSSIQTQGYTLSPNYANCYSNCTPQIIGYTVTNSLQVNLTSSDPTQLGLRAGKAIDTSVKAGANQVYLSFAATSSLSTKLTNQALQQAVSSAYSQAQTIAGSLGVSISGVISATEGSSYTPFYNGPYGAVFAAATVTSISGAPTPIMPGTQSISASIQVVYAIS
jgi:uncharacterized protein YggE